MRTRTAILVSLLLAAVAGLFWVQWPAGFAQQATVVVDPGVVSLRVRFAQAEGEVADWSGSLTATGGEVAALRNWHPRPGDQVSGTSWKLEARKGINFKLRPWEREIPVGVTPYVNAPGLIVDLKAGESARLDFSTQQGNFSVTPGRVAPGKPMRMLGGRVIIDRVPTATRLSADGYENDFATLLSGGGGEMWMAWVGYRNQGNDVFVRRFDGKAWQAAQKVTESPSDVFLAKMGRDGEGRPWVVWSAQVDGNWDLYGRRLQDGRWSPVERLTEAPQPDIYHAMATDSRGRLWLVWQGFRDGQADIFARRYDGTSWSPAERVSDSPANDWEPDVATDQRGGVHVAWDTYDKGDYDVRLRNYKEDAWGAPLEVAATPKYEAHVSLACDREDRVWATWNESGFHWGKDTGFLVKKEATPLYESRWIGLAVYANGAWHEPAAGINESLPADMRSFNDFPRLEMDGTGRPWVFFRHRMDRIRDVPINTPAHRAAWEIFSVALDGDRWTAPMAVPFSQGRIDVHSGIARDSQGAIHVAWPTDNRDFEEFLFEKADVYAARMPEMAGLRAAVLKPRVLPTFQVFPAHVTESADLKRIHDYTIQSGGRTYKIYRGDTHRHTEFSMDGNNDGTLHQTYRYALDAASLDYLAVSEHNGNGGPDVEYIRWLQQQAADLFFTSGRFTPLYGYERSLSYPNGHRNVIFAKRGVPTLPIPPEEAKGQTGAAALYAYLKKFGGIAISHTSATGMGTDWRDNDPAVEPLVEIYQGDRVSAEYEGAPKAANAGNAASQPGGFRPAGYVWNAWAKGYKLGVQASSDHLSTHISYACTIATEFTRSGLLDAMRQRHSYGATDNIILDYRLKAAGKEYLQGDIVDVKGPFQLSVKVIGTMPVRQIDVIRSGKFVHNRNPMQQDVEFTFADNQPLRGESFYYVRVIQVDDQMAWSSPIWVRRN